MTRQMTVFQPMSGDAAQIVDRFRSDPVSWLPGQPRPHGLGRWEIEVRFGPISRPVLCQLAEPWQSGPAWWRRMQWLPTTGEGDVLPMDRVLPVLEADLGIIADKRGSSLVISGSYDVPASLFGEAMDALGLSRVARRTAMTFLADVARHMNVATVPG